MAFTGVLIPSCTPQTQSSLLPVPKSYSLSGTTSLLPPQATQKFLYQPLRYNKISPILVNPGRSFGIVKALNKEEKSYKNVEVFSEEHLALSLAHDVYQLSKKFIRERGVFSVALSDGSSVKYLRKLVEPPYIDTINWSKWHFFWVGEEVLVPADHLKKQLQSNDHFVAKMNHKLAYEEFLSKVPQNHHLNAIEYGGLSAEEVAESYEKQLAVWASRKYEIASSSKGLPKFDLMVLGTGPDDNVGFLTPDHPVLYEKEKWVSVVKEEDATSPPRLTLTLPIINSCSNIAMVVAGSDQADAVYSALKDDDQRNLPAKLVSPDEGQLRWYLDKGAASKLFKEEVHMEKPS